MDHVSSFIWEHLDDLLSLFVLWQKLSPVHTSTKTLKHGILHWHFNHSAKKKKGGEKHFLQFPLDCTMSISTKQEGKNIGMKSREKTCNASPGRKKDERDERRKVYSELNADSFTSGNEINLCSSYISFPALSINQCHISAWKVMNKVLAVTLTVGYSIADVGCVCLCAHSLFMCV